MPKMQLTVEVEEKATLSTKLQTKVKKLLATYQEKHAATKYAKAEEETAKNAIEEAVIDAGEYKALEEGVRVADIPMKVVEGESSYFDKKAFIKHYRLPADCFEKFTKKKPKKPYLSITLPRDRAAADDE